MLKKYLYIVFFVAFGIQAHAQIRGGASTMNPPQGARTSGANGQLQNENKKNQEPALKIPSVIRNWQVGQEGSLVKKTELDTALVFFHNYMPFNRISISSTFTGNNGGAYLSNDFFSRSSSDFYFARSFQSYFLTPSEIVYYNTTTPYSVLDYSQSENRLTHNETRFNVFLTQNVNRKLNLEFIYNQTRSDGQYQNQVNRFHNIALVESYSSDNFVSHSNIIFNRYQGQENGGIDAGQSLNGLANTDDFTTRITGKAYNYLQNNNIFSVNEYRLGKTASADTTGKRKVFIPRVGFIYQTELSGNKRKFTFNEPTKFFSNIYNDSTKTNDSTKYTRLTNIFQIKFYEAPDRKYTFGKRAYIGNDQLWYRFSDATGYFPDKQSNTFVGGGIFRTEGRFWQWQADGRIYIAGYRVGQTELNGLLNKPLKIGRDTTSLRLEGSLKTIVPDYYQQYFYSNHFQWKNNFKNINEMTVRASVRSQEYRTVLGVNYSLVGNYIYNDSKVMPAQVGKELLIISAYLNKDFKSDHWLVRTQLLAQKVSDESYIHLPSLAGFVSINYLTLWSKVMHTQLGVDARYNTAFYADSYDPATSRFYLQNKQEIGNYPFIDLHVNLKLKRTRFFFILMNAASGLVGDNYFAAPDYPYYRRTFRIGLAWSFYN